MRILHFDLLICRKSLTVLICFFFVFGLYFGFALRSMTVVPVSVMIWFAMLAGLPFSIGNKYGVEKLLASFPGSRKNIIKGRFLFALLIGAIGVIQSELIICILGGFFHIGIDMKEIYFYLNCSVILFSLIIAIHMPLYFKLSHVNAIQISPVFLYFIFIVGLQIYYMNGFVFDIKALSIYLWRYGVVTLIGSTLLSGIALYLSYKLTYRLYRKKDL